MQDYLPGRTHFLIGRITAPHGLNGDVRVQALTDDAHRFTDLAECWLVSADEKIIRLVSLRSVRLQGSDMLLLHVAGCDDRTAADVLRGCYLAVERSQAIQLEEDRWFISDLVGCDVFDDQYGNLGHVHEVLQHTAQDVYVITKNGEPDLLFPALKAILRKVDIIGRRIDVRLPDGLYEIYRERRD
ncbi:MAG: 16S rRNA processing protein RimM [Ruminococcaceae bacterium]|nr:16S rRNA processing protein RimM [Oscillospiraceae bacterium]